MRGTWAVENGQVLMLFNAMLERLKALFSEIGSDDAASHGSGQDDQTLPLAAAALLVHAARLDNDFADSERDMIRSILGERFHLSSDEADTLITSAEADDQGGLYEVTRLIRDRLPPEDRVQILEMLWEVAYADGVLSDYEANMARRVAGLLYVPDHESGAARQRVLERLNLNGNDVG